MTDNDEILFKEETEAPAAVHPAREGDSWKILIVDDEADVHSVTVYMLASQKYHGRSFEFLHAYSGAEAKEVLAAHPDIAVILLDVVMETDDSGLKLVQYIREELKNPAVRIILRTGQPGKAPAAKVIVDYDIDDYKEKTELTLEKMLVTIISALRSYRLITTIEENRKGLRRIIEASSNIFERQSLQKLAGGVLSQLTAILQLKKDAIFTHASGLAASGRRGQSIVLAATGDFSDFVEQPIGAINREAVHQALAEAKAKSNGFYWAGDRCAWYFKSKTGSENYLYFEVAKELNDNDQNLLELFFTNVSLAFDNLFLNKGIEDTQKEVIFHIAETMECRSAETGSHVRRVAEFVRLLALKYGLGDEEAENLKLASTIHDLGKIGIPDAILNKPGPLTAEEYEIIKSHVQRGYDMLSRSSSPIIQAAARVILMHHERWDGQGYPQGLKGEEIDFHGSIVAVADVFDALSSKRVYHQAWPWEKIFAYFLEESGKHFDPCLVDILLANREEFIAISEKYRDNGGPGHRHNDLDVLEPGWEIRW
jgi:response regulator RpfG family c-di-GMP phosphodiesterase